MRIRFKLWLEDDAGVLYGDGRQSLLQKVIELGSLAAAAKDLDMSYRAAWGRLKASEKRLDMPLLEPAPKGRGLVLTREAMELVARYQRFHDLVSRAVTESSHRVFGPGAPLEPADLVGKPPSSDKAG